MQPACHNGTVDLIPVPDHISRSPIPGKSLGDLTRNPLRCRVGCDVDRDEISAIKPDDDEGIEQVEANGRDDKTSPWRQRLEHDYAGKYAIPGWAVLAA
jgi:hypothetical protein